MSQAVKVGIFMAVTLAVLAYMIIRVEDLRFFGDPGRRVDAVFDSVAGLDDKSTVRVAGVRVGRVDGIRLEGKSAVVTLLLETPVELREGASAAIANLGLLGDKYLTLDPGPETAPPLADGARISGSSPAGLDQAMAKLNELGDSLTRAADSLGGPDSSFDRLLDNLAATSAEIRSLIAANREQVSATVGHFARFSNTLADEIPQLTDQMERLLTEVESVVSENREGFGDTVEFVREATSDLRTSIDHLNQITGRVARGEGTIGKLVASEAAHEQLVSALNSVEEGVDTLSDTLGRVRDLELDLGFDGYYLDRAEDFRSAFHLTLTPGDSGRFYRLEAIDDPRGRTRTQTDVITRTLADGSVDTETIRQQRTEDDLAISAQVGFRVGDAAFRAGVFESAGGAAVDYQPRGDQLRLSMEAFDFSREDDLDPRLRLTASWRLTRGFHLLGGYDDLLVGDRRSVFLGGSLTWSDDDLKYLLGSLPRF